MEPNGLGRLLISNQRRALPGHRRLARVKGDIRNHSPRPWRSGQVMAKGARTLPRSRNGTPPRTSEPPSAQPAGSLWEGCKVTGQNAKATPSQEETSPDQDEKLSLKTGLYSPGRVDSVRAHALGTCRRPPMIFTFLSLPLCHQ